VAFSGFAGLNAVVHLWTVEAVHPHSWTVMMLRDAPAVHIPAALTLWFAVRAVALRRSQRPARPEFHIGQELAHGTPAHTLWRR
jgi:hypothetical protein